MQRLNQNRPSAKKTPILVAARFAPTVALSLQADPTTERDGLLRVQTSVPGNSPAAAQEVSPLNNRFTRAGFVSDVLGKRLTSAVDEPVSIEFFSSHRVIGPGRKSSIVNRSIRQTWVIS
ncbi:hypothetical protein [Thiocapsa bogorovii]|uniref:hypothetical protein n=1 Tax=Thiocapsa bogorovii TaxID=521689 RepID=UPI001E60A791|nr:hypothetical protein [Thiocapsa bogorovii]UHD14736.1 hypothetical protein LT988_15755 [Thiocapsa bogorovii]